MTGRYLIFINPIPSWNLDLSAHLINVLQSTKNSKKIKFGRLHNVMIYLCIEISIIISFILPWKMEIHENKG